VHAVGERTRWTNHVLIIPDDRHVTHRSTSQPDPEGTRFDDQALDAEGLRHPAAPKKLVSMTERSFWSGVFSGAHTMA
jgi:hypothetical protein